MQIFLTEVFTFMVERTLDATDDSSPSAVRIELEGDLVTDQDLDPMKPHLSREIRKDSFFPSRFYAEECVGKCLFDHSLNELRLLHNVRRNNSRFSLSRQPKHAKQYAIL